MVFFSHKNLPIFFLIHGETHTQNKFIGTMAESICNLRVSGQGILEDVWVDCGEAADPRLECDVPGCCTACFPSGP